MSRSASEKTLLLQERRRNKRLQQEVNTLKIASQAYRERATKAEQEVSEWKRRFDELLKFRHSDAPSGAP